jgi:2-oxo-4-hydroxy-4-carboxy-5-ureidoimidazoline decarboxylase
MRDWWRSGLDRLNGLPADAAVAELLACCASHRWAHQVSAGRPYPDRDALLSAAEAASNSLDWDGVAEALTAHPRIGERAEGASREAQWSRAEQLGAAATDDSLQAALAEGNRAYEERFGHVFLIRAAGRSGQEMLEALRPRLAHDDATERRVVAAELGEIAQLRLDQLLRAPVEAGQR